MAAPEISARVIQKMKQTAEDYLEARLLKLSLQYPHTLMTHSVKQQKMLEKSLAWMLKESSTSQLLLLCLWSRQNNW
jgi:hypothetical protein